MQFPARTQDWIIAVKNSQNLGMGEPQVNYPLKRTFYSTGFEWSLDTYSPCKPLNYPLSA
jgi:hypothetical protein